MAVCVTLNADGTLTPTGETVTECTGYVLVSGTEYGVYAEVQNAFATPNPQDAGKLFVEGVSLVLLSYMVAHLVGRVASFFDRD